SSLTGSGETTRPRSQPSRPHQRLFGRLPRGLHPARDAYCEHQVRSQVLVDVAISENQGVQPTATGFPSTPGQTRLFVEEGSVKVQRFVGGQFLRGKTLWESVSSFHGYTPVHPTLLLPLLACRILPERAYAP